MSRDHGDYSPHHSPRPLPSPDCHTGQLRRNSPGASSDFDACGARSTGAPRDVSRCHVSSPPLGGAAPRAFVFTYPEFAREAAYTGFIGNPGSAFATFHLTVLSPHPRGVCPALPG